jgi:inward rectifier potassium channel
MDLKARVLISYRDPGSATRQYRALELERDQVVLFPLNWTVVHPIVEHSPIFQKTAADLERLDAEFIIVLKGYDDTFSQEIHSIHSYRYNEITWNARFEVMYETLVDGSTVLHVDRLSATQRT